MIVGAPTDEMRRLFDHTVAAQDVAFAALRPGTTCAEVDRAVLAYFEANDLLPYWRQHVGHGIGLATTRRRSSTSATTRGSSRGWSSRSSQGSTRATSAARHSDTVVVEGTIDVAHVVSTRSREPDDRRVSDRTTRSVATSAAREEGRGRRARGDPARRERLVPQEHRLAPQSPEERVAATDVPSERSIELPVGRVDHERVRVGAEREQRLVLGTGPAVPGTRGRGCGEDAGERPEPAAVVRSRQQVLTQARHGREVAVGVMSAGSRRTATTSTSGGSSSSSASSGSAPPARSRRGAAGGARPAPAGG